MFDKIMRKCPFLLSYLCHQDIVLHLLPGLHNADNGRFDFMLSVIIHFLARLFPFGVRLPLFSSNCEVGTETGLALM